MNALLLAAALLAPAQPTPDFAQAWKTVDTAVRETYYDRVGRADMLAQVLAEFGPKASAAKSEAEFSQVVNTMFDRFGDSHFGFYTLADQGYYLIDGLHLDAGAPQLPTLGAWFVPAQVGWRVAMVFDGSAAAGAGLRVGDLVTHVGDQPFSPVESLRGQVGQLVELRVKRGDESLVVAVDVSVDSAKNVFLEATSKSARVIEHEGKKLGYLKLWATFDDDFAETLEAHLLGQAADTDGYLLDLRDGFGGRPDQVIDPFFRPEAELVWDLGADLPQVARPLGYTKPLVVLADGSTRSAKEVIAYVLKSSGRAVLVGRRTAGNVLGTFPVRVQDWGVLTVPRADLLVDGVRLEGFGVEPNYSVEPRVGPNGEDLVLERAKQVLVGTIELRSAPDSGG